MQLRKSVLYVFTTISYLFPLFTEFNPKLKNAKFNTVIYNLPNSGLNRSFWLIVIVPLGSINTIQLIADKQILN